MCNPTNLTSRVKGAHGKRCCLQTRW